MNRWNIPHWLEKAVMERDRACIYCAVSFSTPTTRRGDRPSWEHIVNDESIVTLANIARCCLSCNASKGAKLLRDDAVGVLIRHRAFLHEGTALFRTWRELYRRAGG